jgi:haloalkane dehalogenase
MSRFNRRQWLQAAAALSVAPVAVGQNEKSLLAQAGSWQTRKKRIAVRGLNMAYYEAGAGDPIVFLHGNPTSSYLWRNIIPHVQHLGRCIAPDMIGMGDSDPLPDSGPGKYTFLVHREYLFNLLDRLNVRDRVTFVIHDWGSAMGFTWAQQHAGRVKGIAYMEAIVEPPGAPRPAPAPGSTFAIYRSPQGEQAVLQENRFVENLISGLRYYLTPEDEAEYRRPYLLPGESRRPTLTWPRQLPLGGEPKETYQIVRDYSDWLAAETTIPKLFVRAIPGALLARAEPLEFVRDFKNQTEVTVYGPHFVQEVSPDAIGRALAGWIPSIA